MMDASMPFIGVDTPAEAVVFQVGYKGLLQRFFANQLVGVQRLVPFKQIIQRRIDAAVAQYGAGNTLVGKFNRIIGMYGVSECSMGHLIDAVYKSHAIFHIQRPKNILFQKQFL